MTSRVDCTHWSDCGIRDGGACALGVAGGRPSLGRCGRCTVRVTVGGTPVDPPRRRRRRRRAIADYLRAELSLLLHGPVSDMTQDQRLTHCRQCPSRVRDDADPVGYCDACACAPSQRSRLTIRAWMPAASCPLDKWGPAPGIGRRRLDAEHGAVTAIGIATHAVAQIRARISRRVKAGLTR